MRIKDRIKQVIHTILTANASPPEVAMGCAVGVFVAFLPIVPVQSVLLFLFMVIVPRINRPLAYGVSWVMNPFTIVPIYALEFWTGRLLIPGASRIGVHTITTLVRQKEFTRISHLGTEVAIALLSGGLIWALIAAALTYFLVISLIRRHKGSAVNA